MSKSILIGLNELNFDFIKAYTDQGYLPTFKKLFDKHGYTQTESEKSYELLEPWIQWVSIHTGKTYAEHQVFRLGDIENRNDLEQLWEIAENKGLSVGAVSPFNAKNKLAHSPFFISDPWTNTRTSGNFLIQKISKAVSDSVNNNANNKISKSSLVYIMLAFFLFVSPSQYGRYFKLFKNRKQKSAKPAILDSILVDIYLSLWKKHKPDFSSIFLNSGAHLQHHYLFNSSVYKGEISNPEWYCPANEDPLLSILEIYDRSLERILKLNTRVFIATGLHQVPHFESTYYWRLKNHEEFLSVIKSGAYVNVLPRMSRDLLIECANESQANVLETQLKSIRLNGKELFSIDNRGGSLFIELTYSDDIKKGSFIQIGDALSQIDLFDYVAFVAIKNGEHNGIGYFMDTEKVYDKNDTIKVTSIFNIITKSFDNTK